MKKIKNLLILLLAVIMTSTGLVSCIDNDISPVVEDIYRNQALLLGAQATVQEAEAVLLLAQAAAEQAEATLTLANADRIDALTEGILDVNGAARLTAEQNLLQLVAETALAVETATIALELAQAQFDIDLAALIAQLNEAGADLAVAYAIDYRNMMYAANYLMYQKLDVDEDLAEARLMENSIWEGYALAALETTVMTATTKVEYVQAGIDALLEILNDPASLPAMVTAWENEIDALEVLRNLADAENEVYEAMAEELLAGDDGVDQVREDFVDEYEDQETLVSDWEDDIAGYQGNIDDATAALLGDWAADKQALEDAIEAAILRIGAAEDDNHPSGHAAGFGLLGDIEAQGVVVGDLLDDIGPAGLGVPNAGDAADGGTLPTEVLYDAQLALADHIAAFAALTASYNEAATALAGSVSPDDTAMNSAISDELDAQTDLATAQTTYDDAKTAFEAAPAGSVDTDQAFVAGVDDLDEIGIHSDLSSLTYMQVATWEETSLGSGQYIPATFFPTQYNTADLATYGDAIVAMDTDPFVGGEVGATWDVNDDTDVIIWEQDGSSLDANGDATGLPTNGTYLILTEAQDALSVIGNIDVSTVYFLEVEVDDTSVTNLFTFNVATNELGYDDFAGRAIIGDSSDPLQEDPLTTAADASARYDITPDTDGEDNGGAYALTAQAVAWNAKLLVAIETFEYNVSLDAEGVLQAAYDAQKLLFDDGLATEATLDGDVTAAAGLVTAATLLHTTATTALTDLTDELGVEYTAGARPYAANLMLSADDHINDGVPAGSEMYEEDLASAIWDATAETLTAYAELWNAEKALFDLEGCDDACQNAIIADNTHLISLIQPALDVSIAILADMQAEYDAIMEVYVDGDLDADLLAEYNMLMNQHVLLKAEEAMYQAQIDYLEHMIDQVDEDDDLEDIADDIDDMMDDLEEAIDDLEDAEEALASAQADGDANTAYIAYLEALTETLGQRIENALALAANYLAMMEAALAS